MNSPCPACGQVYRVRPDQIGRKIACKQCGARLLVTEAGLTNEPPPAPSYPPGATVYTYQPPPPQPPRPNPPAPLDFDDPPPQRRRRSGGSNPVFDFLTFRLMLTPFLIQLFFWIGTAGCLWAGFKAIVGSFDSRPVVAFDDDDRPLLRGERRVAETRRDFDPFRFVYGVGILVLGPLFLRLVCEEGIILFKIHEELREQTDRARYRDRG